MKNSVVILLLTLTSFVYAQFPWSNTIPTEIKQSALEPECVLDEEPGDWRPPMSSLFIPLVRHCQTARDAVLTVASQMTKTTGVFYSTQRRYPAMNALEALQDKKVSCTGQSILLVCALRSIGIPARAVGVGTWGHIRGNHTWCEAWFDGAWHMIEFNEADFNTPWVMEYIGMLNPQLPSQRIYAASPKAKDGVFPTVWNPASRIAAEDVTERYMHLSRIWYEKAGLPSGTQRLLVDMTPRPPQPCSIVLENEDGEILEETTLPTTQDDMRRLSPLNLPRAGRYFLRLKHGSKRWEVLATHPPVQVKKLPMSHMK